ncbi:MAG: ATP-grasp domain-containing protein [Planctomycetota bacterium]
MSTQTLQLLVVGFSARWLQESASRGGLRSRAVDFFADADTGEHGPVSKVSSWRDVPRLAASWKPEAIIVGGGFETQPAMVKRLRAVAPLLNCSTESCLASRDPRRWSAPLESAGLRVPRMLVEAKSEEIREESDRGEWLVKNRYSAGGNRVRQWKRVEDILARKGRRARGEYLQQRIEGEPYSLLFWLQPGQRLCLGFFRQLCGEASLGAKPFQFVGAIGPLPVDTEEVVLFQRVACTLADDLGLSGLVGVDLIRSAHGLFAIEINPRPTATAELWELAFSNQSLVGKLWEARAGRLLNPEWIAADSNNGMKGKAVVYWREERPLIVDSPRADLFRRAWLDGWLKDLPAEGTTIEAGEPVATVFASGLSCAEVRTKLQSRVDNLLKELTGDS